MKLGIKGHMYQLLKEGTYIIQCTEKTKTRVLKITNAIGSNSFFITIVCGKHKIY